jgi:hypothetical protein
LLALKSYCILLDPRLVAARRTGNEQRLFIKPRSFLSANKVIASWPYAEWSSLR